MFSLQTWNLWWGGTKVDDGHRKMVEIVRNHGADIICTQECYKDCARAVFEEIGHHHAQQDFDCAVSAAFDVELLETPTAPYATAAWVAIPAASGEPRRVLVWSVHLAPWDYGPYAALKGEDPAVINTQPEERQRQEQIAEILKLTAQLSDSSTPVIIAGDFNSPATMDWTQRSDRPDYQWLPTDAPLKAGFTDAYRAIYPDAATVWGDTWSPIEPLDKEPRDRIDFIFVKNLVVCGALTRGVLVEREEGYSAPELGRVSPSFSPIGTSAQLIPNQSGNEYPSDHNIVEVQLDFVD